MMVVETDVRALRLPAGAENGGVIILPMIYKYPSFLCSLA